MIKWKKVATRKIEICWTTGLEWQYLIHILKNIELLNEISTKKARRLANENKKNK